VEDVPNDRFDMLESAAEAFEQHYARGGIKPLDSKIDPVVEKVPPAGWLTKAQAVDLSGIDKTLFESMIEDTDPNRDGRSSWSGVFISETWVEFYAMDPGFASLQMFMRFTAEAFEDVKLLNIRHADLFKLNQYLPSKKQLATLWTMLDNPFLTPAERWLVELCITDGRITKSEIGLLFKHFFGESDWIGGRWMNVTNGVLDERRNRQ